MSTSSPLRQEMNSHDAVGRTQTSYRTEAVSWRYEVGDAGFTIFSCEPCRFNAEEKGRPDAMGPSGGEVKIEGSLCTDCPSSTGSGGNVGILLNCV